MKTRTRSRTRVRGMGELIAVLPYQLGYTPTRSLVMVLLREREPDGGPPAGEMGMTVRVDLPPPEHEQEVVDHLMQVLRRQRPHVVQLIAYEDQGEDSTELLRALDQRCAEQAILVDTQARVCGGRWRRVVEPDGSRPQWRPVPAAADVPAVADLVLQGASPGQDRPALVARLDAGAPLTHQAVRQAVLAAGPQHRTPADARWVQEGGTCAWAAVLHTGQGAREPRDLSATELAHAAMSLADVGFRDALISWLMPGQYSTLAHPPELMSLLAARLPVSRVRNAELVDRLIEVCARTPPELRTPMLTVLAVLAWWHGNGTVANIAIERALQADPDYRLAQLLDQLLQHAVGPPRAPWQAGS